MSESVPMPESIVSAARAAATLPAAAESCGTQAPTAPAAVRGPGALSRWETLRAVMRLELLVVRRWDTGLLVLPVSSRTAGWGWCSRFRWCSSWRSSRPSSC